MPLVTQAFWSSFFCRAGCELVVGGSGAVTTWLPTIMVGATKKPLNGFLNLVCPEKFAILVVQLAMITGQTDRTAGGHLRTDWVL